MTMMRRVLLLLSVAVLLREGSSNSPLDYLRDLKNRIFASSNSTESTEEPSTQCSGLDQDGVCSLQKTAVNGSLDESENLNSTETFGNPDPINGSQSSDTDMLATDQLVGNQTAVEDTNNTNNTQYYDEQEWNSTATNNTDNYRNDFEYPENEQNGTDFNSETPAVNGEEISNQTENTRSKRQINKVEINITLKTPGAKPKPLTLSTTVLTGKSENSTDSSILNQSNNATGGKEAVSNGSKINTSSNQDEVITTVVNATDENKTVVMTESTGNETKENIINDGQKTNDSTNTNSETGSSEDQVILSPNDTISDFPKSQNTTEEINNDETNLINCTDCVATEEGKDLKNISLSLDKDLNGTEYTDSEQGKINENSIQADSISNTSQTIITKLKDLLENSTRIIGKIVQNIVPTISKEGNETKAIENDTKLENTGTQNTNTTEEQINSSEATESNNTQIESGGDRQLNSATSLTNITSENNLKTTRNTSNENLNISKPNMIETPPLELNLNDSMALESNTTHNEGIKREKRSINFTILSEDDEETDFSASTFPDATEHPSSTINSTESSSWNGTQEIEIVGPVCKKQYEQCTNSTDCCEDYECTGTGENNATLYCDLRPGNLTLTTSLPITEGNAE